jgi:hypothetical protein
VTLTATPASGSTFTGWSGACSGTGACVVTMNAAVSVTAQFGGSSPTTAYALSAAAATAAPVSATVTKGASRTPMLALDLTGNVAGALESLTVTSSGTGNDAADVTAVELFVDANGNGKVDTGEIALASGSFSANDGTLVFNTPVNLPAGATHVLVTASFASVLAVAGAAGGPHPPSPRGWWSALLALLAGASFMIVRRGKRRRIWKAATLALVIASCGGGSDPTVDPNAPRTYRFTATALSARSSGLAATVTGLPIAGATVSVQP